MGSGRQKEGGYLAVHKQDFLSHVSGQAWPHYADSVLMCPPLTTIPGDNVQEVLENIEILINSLGGMFVTIGLTADLNVDYVVGSVATPTLATALVAAFADVHVATTGGIVVILAGEYYLDATITIPHGIMLWGENGGVTISGEVSDAPMFIIETADPAKKLSIGYDDIAEVLTEAPVQSTKLVGMTLVDNLRKNNGSGGVGDPYMRLVPMVSCQKDCNVIFDSVTFIGCIGADNNTTTYRAIGFNTTVPLATGTSVSVLNCVIDGVSSCIEFLSNMGTADFLRIESCRMRYFGTGAATGDKAAIYTTLCNAQIENNKILGYYLAGVFEPGDGILLNATAVSDTEVRFNVLNNSGTNNQGTSGEQLSFINISVFLATLSAGTAFRGLTDKGNNWGTAYGSQDFEIVVGNSARVGDINGTYALELALDRSQASGGARSQVTIYVLPGTYIVREGGSSQQYARLIGMPSRDYKVEVQLALTSTYSDGMRYTLNLGPEIRNIHFVGTADSAFRSVTAVTPYSADIAAVISGCSFYDCGLVISKNSNADANYTRNVKVENCYFLQAQFTNNLSCWIPTSSFDVISVEKCQFFGKGYQLFIGKDYRNYTSREGVKINVTDCEFDSTAYASSILTAPLTGSWSTYQNRYLTIEDYNADIVFNNNTFKATPASNAILQAALDAGLTFTSVSGNPAWLRVVGRSVDISNLRARGLWQGTASGYRNVAFLDGYALSQFTMRNSTIIAGLPMRMYDTSTSGTGLRGEHNGNKTVMIDNCHFSQPDIAPGFDSVTCLFVNLPTITTTYAPSTGLPVDIPNSFQKLTIKNCSMQQSTKPSGGSATSLRYPCSASNAQGAILQATMDVGACGWSVCVDNNTVLSKHPTYTSKYAGMSIDTKPQLAVDYGLNAQSTITNNKVVVHSQTLTSSGDCSVCVYLAWAWTVFSGNALNYIINSTPLSDGNKRGFMIIYSSFAHSPSDDETPEGALSIQNNIFHQFGELDVASFWIEETAQYNYADCIFDNNVIVNDKAGTATRHWFNIVPSHWRVKIIQTQNTNVEAGIYTPPSGYQLGYQSAEITYYCWADDLYTGP